MTFYYGGDYNPDQWPEEIQNQDFELFKEASINMLTLPVFSWAKFQSDEETYHFDWFDKILDKIRSAGMNLCFATSTAVQPAWMSRKYPEMLPVDFEGRRRKFGGRVKFCPNNRDYRRLSLKLVEKLMERYSSLPEIKIWHVGNEYDNWCYCEQCENDFRDWLKNKYKTLDALNRAWYTNFWGHTLYAWEEIAAPSELSEMWNDNGRLRTNFQVISLDYARFMSESIYQCYKAECDLIRQYSPNVPITTNFMGFFKPLDYFKWAEGIDIISWDSYPAAGEPEYIISMRHDLMRSLKRGKPFLLMEQTPSQQNWQPFNSIKRPGVMRLQSYQAIAKGADSVMFFQMRRSIGACEKFHSAVIDHVGTSETRVFRECAALGDELKRIGGRILGSTVTNRAAIIFDWENWWALEYSSGPSNHLDYLKQVESFYQLFNHLKVGVDFVHPESDLSQYELVVAPCLYMLSLRGADNITAFTRDGGSLVTTFLSSIVDDSDRVHPGGYPGPLKEVLGIWVEEFDALPPGKSNSVSFTGFERESSRCDLICDVIHCRGAETLAVYNDDYYKGFPAVTRHQYGGGEALYIGTALSRDALEFLLKEKILKSQHPLWKKVTVRDNVEGEIRSHKDEDLLFLLNHGDRQNVKLSISFEELITGQIVSGTMEIPAGEVRILSVKKGNC